MRRTLAFAAKSSVARPGAQPAQPGSVAAARSDARCGPLGGDAGIAFAARPAVGARAERPGDDGSRACGCGTPECHVARRVPALPAPRSEPARPRLAQIAGDRRPL